MNIKIKNNITKMYLATFPLMVMLAVNLTWFCLWKLGFMVSVFDKTSFFCGFVMYIVTCGSGTNSRIVKVSAIFVVFALGVQVGSEIINIDDFQIAVAGALFTTGSALSWGMYYLLDIAKKREVLYGRKIK